MAEGQRITLQEIDGEWVAIPEDSERTGRGETAQAALLDLEGDHGETETGPVESVEDLLPGGDREWPLLVSPRVELLFAVAALGFGGVYLLAGNVGGAVLVAVGVMLLLRLAWVEYGLLGPKE